MSKVGPPPPPPSYDSLGFPPGPNAAVPQPVMPVVTDPSAAGHWMARPQASVSCPPGLEYLGQLEQVIMHQEIELGAGGLYGQTASRVWYKMLNSSSQQIYTAMEGSSNFGGCCVCLPAQRGYNVNIRDNSGNEVMRIVRDPLCCACCPCLGCEHHNLIECPPGQVIGHFRSEKGCGGIKFVITNASDEVVFTISFPACAVSTPQMQQEFNIYSSDGSKEVARMAKHWTRIEYPYRLKKYTISFPRDMDTRMKAVLMATIFAIDVMYYPPLQIIQRRGRRM